MDKNGIRSINTLKDSETFQAFASTIKGCEMMESSDTYQLLNTIALQLGFDTTIDKNKIMEFYHHAGENIGTNNIF